MKGPELRTIDVDVESLDTRGKTVVGYAAVYNTLSEPLKELGGARERIAPHAFSDVLGADVRALLNHDANEVLGRTKSGTLRLHDEERGLRFELDLPDSPLGENVRSAVKRGDIDGASFRFVAGDEDWDGDIRTITRVAELHDVTIATYPAYPDASIELRTRQQEEPKMGEQDTSTADVEAPVVDKQEERSSVSVGSTGTLRVSERDQGGGETRTLFGMFKEAGWTHKTTSATIPWLDFERAAENRAWSGSADLISPLARVAPNLGFDQRWLWPVLPRTAVDAGVTSVSVFNQSARSLVSGGTSIRAIDSVASKPTVGGTMTVSSASLKQVAGVQVGVPNVFLENQNIESIIANDLRLNYFEALDFHANAQLVASSGTQTQAGAELLPVIRRTVTYLWGLGYAPDVLVLPPSSSETLDTLLVGGTLNNYVFAPGQFAPQSVYGLSVRTSKNAATPIVLDSSAYARLYQSPVSLQRFEENAGLSNSSLIRLESNALVNVERSGAACRIT